MEQTQRARSGPIIMCRKPTGYCITTYGQYAAGTARRVPYNCCAAHFASCDRSILELCRGSTGSLRLNRMA